MNAQTVIRDMAEGDWTLIAQAFAAQGWPKPVQQYLDYWQEHRLGQRDILLAEYEQQFAGYVTIRWVSDYPPFYQAGIPELADFNVLLKYRRLKIGTALLAAAEARIALRSPVAGLGVGLHADYGAAQVLYIRRGYVPDGKGIFYHGHYPTYGDQVQVGDDLTLQLTKRLRPE
jgi:GNAT superfamily N-acetyltransferase